MLPLYIGLAVYILGSAFDVYTTKRAVIDNPSRFHEGNPLMAPVVGRFGWIGLAAVKLAPVAILLVVAFVAHAHLAAGIGLAAMGVTFGYVGWRNRTLIRSRR